MLTLTKMHHLMLNGSPLGYRQWGNNAAGDVAFPVAFTRFSKIVVTHPGTGFLNAWPQQNNNLTRFKLLVTQNSDANWIAIGY